MAATARLICTSQALEERKQGVRFSIQRQGETLSAFVVRFEGQPRAYLNRCAHVPIELDWQPGEFFDHSGLYLVCATHGALYAPESGQCLGGRCNGRGLESLPVEERDGAIYYLESD